MFHFAASSGESGIPLDTFQPKLAKPRSVYVHIPFCRHRCGYCNFSLVAGRDHLIDRFLRALEIEIRWIDQRYEIETLFLGGGTPSHLSPAQLARLGEIIGSRFTLTANAEITAECNPNDVNPARMLALTELGVNRVSLGAQSLNPSKLRRLERDHTEDDIRKAIETARDYSAVVSLDLIFAAPGETLTDWQQDLEQAILLNSDHLSTYELTYEKGTRFWNDLNCGKQRQTDEDLRAEMYTFTIDVLHSNEMHQYEVSSFAKTGRQCRHNVAYWTGDPYFAFGPGAARFIDGIRESNHQSTMHYLKRVESGQRPVAERERLGIEEAARERLAIGLRRIVGVADSDFEFRTGTSVKSVLGHLESELVELGLLIHENAVWRLSRNGILVCDWIAGRIVSG